ncbi:hypothetical protein E2C01_057288 [Portunus trituberculatus]|uniref:Uncharacterized protein n=1 Tax=Portunus trituberculatus TaxID=210409 RepID=A0A5B7H2Y6_PORTR|nr:hypothetical protein [Portunus trituberculatus]
MKESGDGFADGEGGTLDDLDECAGPDNECVRAWRKLLLVWRTARAWRSKRWKRWLVYIEAPTLISAQRSRSQKPQQEFWATRQNNHEVSGSYLSARRKRERTGWAIRDR